MISLVSFGLTFSAVMFGVSLVLLGIHHKRVRCTIRGMHRDIKRHPLGGFVCGECEFVGYDYEEMGWTNGGYVPHLRTTFSREHKNGDNENVYGINNIERRAW